LTRFCEISIIELPRAIKAYQENKQDEIIRITDLTKEEIMEDMKN